jgi:hypothetical protein
MFLGVDDNFDVYFGTPDKTEGDSILYGGSWSAVYTCADAVDPNACNGHRHTDYLYVVTAANWGGANGFLGYFKNTTLNEETITGNGDFEVFPAGRYPATNPNYYDSTTYPAYFAATGHGHWNNDHATNAKKLPTQAEVDNAIDYAQKNNLWEVPYKEPGGCWFNQPDPFVPSDCDSKWTYDPWSSATPYAGIPTNAQWIWWDSGYTVDCGSPDPFCGYDHDEFLVFRIAGAITQAPK